MNILINDILINIFQKRGSVLKESKKQEIIEDIEWAKRAVENGSVYHVKWAQKYISDCNALLDEVLRLEDRLETYDKQAEERVRFCGGDPTEAQLSQIKLEVEHRADEIMAEADKK